MVQMEETLAGTKKLKSLSMTCLPNTGLAVVMGSVFTFSMIKSEALLAYRMY